MICIGSPFLAGFVVSHLRRAHVHGSLGVLLAHDPSALGRVPEQVLQGRWLQVCSIQLRSHLARGPRQGVNEFVFRSQFK